MVARLGVLATVATCALGCRQLLGFDEPARATPGDDAPLADATDAPTGAWLEPWTHRKSITIPVGQVIGEQLVDFPVLVSTGDSSLGAIALADGSDITFTAADATTVLASEIEAYSGGTLVAWVKAPILSSATETRLYMYYGNPLPPPSNAAAVWTASYHAVWHLGEDPGPGGVGDMRDSTVNAHHGTAAAVMLSSAGVQGQIGNAVDFNGTDEFITLAAADFGNQFTISMWMRLQTTTTGIRTLLANSDVGLDTNGFRFFVNSNASADHRVLFETGNGTVGSGRLARTAANAIAVAAWHHVAVTVDRTTGTGRIFVDGDRVDIDDSISATFSSSSDFRIATMENGVPFFGELDEVEVASTVRPLGWIATAFANQRSPSAFSTFGAEETR